MWRNRSATGGTMWRNLRYGGGLPASGFALTALILGFASILGLAWASAPWSGWASGARNPRRGTTAERRMEGRPMRPTPRTAGAPLIARRLGSLAVSVGVRR